MNDDPLMSGKTISTMLGEIVWLMSQSRSHKRYAMDDLNWLVIPALLLGQYRMFYDEEDRPVAYASWAFLTPEAEDYLLKGRGLLRPDDWRPGGLAAAQGERLPDPITDADNPELTSQKTCIVDIVAPIATPENGVLASLIEDLRKGPLPARTLYARRLASDGKSGALVELQSSD